MPTNSIGSKIASRRKQLGLTQAELAERMGYKSKSTINKIEKGENDVPQRKIVLFAEVLKVSVSYLMDWEAEEPAPLSDEEAELMEYLDMLRSRPECRLLLKTYKGSTKEEVLILSSQEKAFILWLRSLPPEKRQAVLNFQDMF